MFYLFSKCVNVIRIQSSNWNRDESVFRTIYIMVRASYVNFTMHCRTMSELFTQWWNDLTIDWNDLTWNDLTMERNDRIPSSLFKIFPWHGIKENKIGRPECPLKIGKPCKLQKWGISYLFYLFVSFFVFCFFCECKLFHLH